MSGAEPDDYKFDVAISFAGEDREYVEEIVGLLKAKRVRVFYDTDYLAETWGEDLLEYFDDVYRKLARYAIMFISRHYAEKVWCRHERRSALARALEERRAYVLPVRLDDTALDGLRPTVGYLDARRFGTDGIVRATLEKLRGAPPPISAITRVPRTEAEQQQLLADRPGGWEYLYFASELLREHNALEHKHRDHEMRYAAPTGSSVRREEALDYLQTARAEALRLANQANVVMDPAAQARAFGPPGVSGDPERILHLAKRWTSVYEGLMDWSARLRGTTVPIEYGEVVESLARFSDASVGNYRAFVDQFVDRFDGLPAAIAAGEEIRVEMVVVFDIPDDVGAAFDDALARVAGH
jgi:hypothetical protein